MVILAAAVTLLSEREASETVENKIYQKLKKGKKWNVTLILDLFFTIKYDNLHLLLFKKKTKHWFIILTIFKRNH